jgi:hypothetical protein
MAEPKDALTLQMLESISSRPRSYADVLDAWRTSCPRLSVCEDACADGLIDYDPNGDRVVRLSARGRDLLASRAARADPARS